MKLTYLILILLITIWRAHAAITIVEKHHVGMNITVIILGVAIIFLFSFTGAILPILLKKKNYIKLDSTIFGSLKIFGVGIIVGVAFIHILIPGDQLLISKNSPYFFREKHPHFCGALVIIGIIFSHLIQVLMSHVLQTRVVKKKNKESIDNTSSESEKTLSITSIKDITENRPRKILDEVVDNREKQVVFYLVEISVAIHTIIIGSALGISSIDKIIPLIIALAFHQFYGGIAISSIFLEAKFTRIKPYLVMIALFTLTLPVGAFLGIILRESFNDDDSTSIGIQGCINIIASGILIYDSLASILSRQTSSKTWKSISFGKKVIQLLCFYIGLFIMGYFNTWI
ncbi:Zinc/iron permease [Neocallimastix californiae]|uniref:Zinc/iron permease n=1 Tax=Neocallimastix californiae TaxID=1754190 RepID=A0A1Y2C938_9FUNG|nr:Zinc/iron permease [Neocallimastix californiae]|eukprot:ORY43553.1 Zinc/iron permease [Neocallimastix californiae]